MSRFCFSNEDDFVDSLLKNNVQLFLTTDINEMAQASRKGREVSSFLAFITVNYEGELWFQFTYMGKQSCQLGYYKSWALPVCLI